MYNLIMGKQNLHNLGAVTDFKENTIIINEILLPMRNINNLQLKPGIFRALKQNTCLAEEPVNMRNTSKHVVKILDTKYDKQALSKTIALT